MQVGLVDEVLDLLPALVRAQGDGRGAGAWVVGAEAGCTCAGDDVAVVGLAHAGQVGDARVLVELIAQTGADDVDVGTEEIIVLRVHRHVFGRLAVRYGADQEAAHVGIVVGLETVVVERDIELVGRRPEAGQRQALALAVGGAAIRDLFVAIQQVGAHGEVCVDDLVGVQRQASVLVGAKAGRQASVGVIGAGLLGHRVDRSARGAAPGEAGVRAFGDLDLFGGKALANAHAGVAQAVDEDVAARFLAADDVAVAKGVAVLAGAQGDAGLGIEDLAQVGVARVFDLGLGQHLDVLRGVGQRALVALIPRVLGLVGHAGFGVRVGFERGADDLDGFQPGLGRGFLFLGVGRHGCQREGGQADGHCRGGGGVEKGARSLAQRCGLPGVRLVHGHRGFLITVVRGVGVISPGLGERAHTFAGSSTWRSCPWRQREALN